MRVGVARKGAGHGTLLVLLFRGHIILWFVGQCVIPIFPRASTRGGAIVGSGKPLSLNVKHVCCVCSLGDRVPKVRA